MGGLGTLEKCYDSIQARGGSGRISPYSIPAIIANMAAGQISIHYGLRGISTCITNACASGANALGEAFEALRYGKASVALAGGAEATVTPIGIGAFQAMFALSRRNEDPTRASRPFDRSRDGFVCAEGSAVLVLETLERARTRGAKIYAEITGYGVSSDAHHTVQPSPEGRGARVSMQKALRSAGLNVEQIDYVNAHGTSTPQGDVHECKAIVSVFGDHATSGNLWVSSTKSMTGHLLGAAGALEGAVCALSCARGVVAPTINLEEKDPECAVDVVPNVARERRVRHALSNSFGFGGTNASLVFSQLESL
jgi:3-oxoacyl-[acyl-carrier-protein] synthase II